MGNPMSEALEPNTWYFEEEGEYSYLCFFLVEESVGYGTFCGPGICYIDDEWVFFGSGRWANHEKAQKADPAAGAVATAMIRIGVEDANEIAKVFGQKVQPLGAGQATPADDDGRKREEA